jgi:hypothetical protein
VRVFPNPAKNVLNVDFGGDETMLGKYLSVYNGYGQLLMYKVITTNRMALNIGPLATGIYFVKTGDDKKTIRFLKTAY